MLLAHAAAWFNFSRCDSQIRSVVDYECSIICCESQIIFFQEWDHAYSDQEWAWKCQADVIHQLKNVAQWHE